MCVFTTVCDGGFKVLQQLRDLHGELAVEQISEDVLHAGIFKQVLRRERGGRLSPGGRNVKAAWPCAVKSYLLQTQAQVEQAVWGVALSVGALHLTDEATEAEAQFGRGALEHVLLQDHGPSWDQNKHNG